VERYESLNRPVVGFLNLWGEEACRELPELPMVTYTFAAHPLLATGLIGAGTALPVYLNVWAFCFFHLNSP